MRVFFALALALGLGTGLGLGAGLGMNAAQASPNSAKPSASDKTLKPVIATRTPARHRHRGLRRVGAKKLADIRKTATARTLSYIRELRPVASNYGGMRAAVRSYWRRNTANPSASALGNTILRYVQPLFRPIARPEVMARARNGVAQVKAALRK